MMENIEKRHIRVIQSASEIFGDIMPKGAILLVPLSSVDKIQKEDIQQHRQSDLFLSLLAIIHRDGGHYTEKHGFEKSYDDAVTKICNWIWNKEK